MKVKDLTKEECKLVEKEFCSFRDVNTTLDSLQEYFVRGVRCLKALHAYPVEKCNNICLLDDNGVRSTLERLKDDYRQARQALTVAKTPKPPTRAELAEKVCNTLSEYIEQTKLNKENWLLVRDSLFKWKEAIYEIL